MTTDSLSEEEHERIQELCDDGVVAMQMGRLTTWEEEFLEDISGSLAQYGKNMRLTVKQWEIIERLEKKVYAI